LTAWEDIANVVNESATCNVAQLCGTEAGDVLVPVYDWTKFLGKFFRKMIGIKKYHHFQFQHDSTSVICKQFVDSDPVEFVLLSKALDFNLMPEIVVPAGLDPSRQWYLYDEIRPFVSEEMKDRVTPLPECPKPTQVSMRVHDSDEEERPSEPKAKKGGKGKGVSTKGKKK